MPLRDKLKALTAPSREVDAEIFNKIFRHTGAHAICVDGDWLVDTQGTEHGNTIPRYTARLDAVVALVLSELPEWFWSFKFKNDYYTAELESRRDYASAEHTLPAVALLLALVDAKEIE